MENPDSRILDSVSDELRAHLVQAVKVWLGPSGTEFFAEMLDKHKRVNAVFTVPYGDGTKRYPHAVHFHEGMQVRNFLRSLPETSSWSVYDYDNCWADLVHEAVTGSRLEEQEMEESPA